MYKIKKNKKGITLVEILISITIIMIMTTAISLAFLERESEISLSLFRNQLIGCLRYSQVRSMNSVNRFGIHIENNRYVLFKDKDRNNLFGSEEKIRNIDLPQGIIFTALSVGQNIVFQEKGSISLPSGITNINISITNIDSTITKNISINSLGLIN